jgi:ankyrin repeat-rich membrane spanning protein
VEKVSRHLDTLKLDGYVQLLKKEVETIGNMTRCMDAFTNNHTRLVVIVDGLDSCEQDKLLQVLDMVGFQTVLQSV